MKFEWSPGLKYCDRGEPFHWTLRLEGRRIGNISRGLNLFIIEVTHRTDTWRYYKSFGTLDEAKAEAERMYDDMYCRMIEEAVNDSRGKG